MIPAEIGLLDDTGVRAYGNNVVDQAQKLDRYSQFYETGDGRFIVAELEAELALVKDLYSAIPINAPEVSALLAGFQAREFVLRDLIVRIRDAKRRREELERIGKEVSDELKRRETARKETGGTFLPEGYERKGG